MVQDLYLSHSLYPHAPEQPYSGSCKEMLPQQATSQACSHFSQSVLEEKKGKEKNDPVVQRSNTCGQPELYKQMLSRHRWQLLAPEVKQLKAVP